MLSVASVRWRWGTLGQGSWSGHQSRYKGRWMELILALY